MKIIAMLATFLAVAATTAPRAFAGPRTKKRLDPSFVKMDINKDRFISLDEWIKSVGLKKEQNQASIDFARKDKNKDGALSYEEFKDGQ